MAEWCPESMPMHSFEIATVDQNNNLIGGFPIQAHGNPHQLPLTICRKNLHQQWQWNRFPLPISRKGFTCDQCQAYGA